MKEISIVIPVYNSAECVEELSRQIADTLQGIDYEQIMVNDCSKDDSWKKIVQVSQTNTNIRGINLRKNCGQDSAILAGLNYASGAYVVIMDDDLQHSPADILRLYEKVKNGSDVCYANFSVKKQRTWKNIGSWFNGKISEIVIGKPKSIYLSPFKIMTRDIVRDIVKFNNLYPYIDGLIFQLTTNITQIDVEHHVRAAGKSNYNFIRSVKVFFKMLFGFSTVPLRLASYLGFISAFAGFLLAVYYFIEFLRGAANVEGWTTIVILMLFLGGLILVSLGIIGVYIGRTYLTINNSPKFVVGTTTDGETERRG